MAAKHHIIAFNSVNLLLIAICTPFTDTAKPIMIRAILIALIISPSFHSVVASSVQNKYVRIGYKVVTFSYWVGESIPMTIHLEKVV